MVVARWSCQTLLSMLFIHVVYIMQVDENSGAGLQPLPEGWEKGVDGDSGETYYFNSVTGQHASMYVWWTTTTVLSRSLSSFW